MSEIRQLDELREYITAEDEISWDGHKTAWVRQDSLLIYLAAIENEIAERFMELPLDADGVPCRIGDELRSDPDKLADACNTGGIVTGVANGTVFLDRGCIPLRAGALHHVNPRTVEDVLRDLADAARLDRAHLLDDGDIEGYAAEIRELMGGE